ncbi:MAG: HAMP domain-containing histidine kinase [Myxococcales bacterium]|nr:MAG: HAMP domain-containing histidine kinase [Myxococcales bacterium]
MRPSDCDTSHPFMRERWRMQRHMFLWFGATIMLTMVVVGGVFRLMMKEGPTLCREESRVRHFHKASFERVWDRPEERQALVQLWATEFGATVSLRDAHGHELSREGTGSCDSPKMVVDLGRPDEPKGQVVLCSVEERDTGEKARNLGLALLAAACTVWAISGIIARRVARPLGELTRVAQDLGAGRFDSRVEAAPHRGEIGVLGHVLNDMAARIERQMADQRALLATVSHEIRTPLARMRILVEMARDQATDPVSLDKIDAEVLEIDQLVAELLASSRIDFSALAFNPLDARRVATDALERADIDPTVLSFDAPRPIFRGDPTLVSRAVLNLLENARRHAGGVTELRVFEAEGRIVFEVHDQGPGLAPGDSDKIFQPFYRGRNNDGRSVGLGLALVKRIAQAHGGDAAAFNHPDGRGACVTVSFALPTVDIPPPVPSSQSHLSSAMAL